jgi:5-methylcytosine-specific restriction endonuclease McrA
MQATLVLNASYEPLSIVPATRAVSLILAGRAVSVDDSPKTLHSVSQDIQVPYVVRLNRFVRKNAAAKNAKFSRRGVMIRDGFTCVYCDAPAETIDHVIPRTRGGGSTYENCVAACVRCNRKKGHKSLADLNWALPVSPKAPSLFATMLGRVRNNDEQLHIWGQYIVMFQPELQALLDHPTMNIDA